MYFTHLYKNFLMYPSTVYNELTSMGNKKNHFKEEITIEKKPRAEIFHAQILWNISQVWPPEKHFYVQQCQLLWPRKALCINSCKRIHRNL